MYVYTCGMTASACMAKGGLLFCTFISKTTLLKWWVYVCVYIHIHMCIHVCVYMWDDRERLYGERRPFILHFYLEDDTVEVVGVCVCIYTCTYVYACIHVYIVCMYMCVCVCICMYVYVSICMYGLCMHMYVCICLYVCMYYVCMH